MVVLKSLHPPSEGVRLQQADTTAVVDGKILGSGTLFVAEALHAVSRDLSAFHEEHLYVMVNAKLDDEAEAEQLDKASDDEESDSDDEDLGTITEIRFVPSDKTRLEPMFSSMCDCQALHPDPDDVDTDDDDYEGEEYDVEEAEQEQGQVQGDVPVFYSYEEGLSQLTSEGQATLERLEGMLAQYHMAGVRNDQPSAQFEEAMEVDSNTVAGQFDDADEQHFCTAD